MVSKNVRALANRTATGTQSVSYLSRPGEGVVVDVLTARQSVSDGIPRITFTLDLAKAQVPSRRFYANAVQVATDEGDFHLCFGQKKLFRAPGNKLELRALLDVVMVSEALTQFLNSLKDHDFKGIASGSLSEFTDEPAQTVPLNANFAAVSVGPEESCLDFYHSSAFELAAVANGQRSLHMDPVVRVILPTSLFRILIEELRRIEPAEHSAVSKTEAVS